MPRSYHRFWVALGGAVVVAGLFALSATPLALTPIPANPLHARQLRGAHDATARAAARAGEEALRQELAARRLSPVMLEVVTIEATDAQLGAVVAWTPFVFERDGRGRPAIADQVLDVSSTSAPQREFVADAAGGIWQVERAPNVRIVGHQALEGCDASGGFHSPVPLESRYERRVWLLAPGQTYRGVVTISYDAPAFDLTFTLGACPQPA